MMIDKYSNDYKHFDNLIWQLPGWSTAIFVLAITGIAFIADAEFININMSLSKKTIATGFLLICLFFQLAIFNALVRFRDHQFETKKVERFVFAKWWFSGQFWLQNAIIMQAGALSFLTFNIAKEEVAITISIILILIMFFYSLITVYFKTRQ